MADPDGRLGEKILEIRKKRGLTQKELAGDKITRNMLSLIESGKASPSVDTLAYLAERLDVPAGYFIPRDSNEEERLLRLTFIDDLRKAFRNSDWQKCVGMCPASSDDETAYILAHSHLMIAYGAAEKFEIASAMDELEAAEKQSRGSVYCRKSFFSAIEYCRHLFLSLCTDEIPNELCDVSGVGEELPCEIPAYFITLKSLRAGESAAFPFELTSHRKEHITAAELSMEEDYAGSAALLRRLADDTALPSYMRYRVLCDLETAADLSGNVRLAYSTSRRKLALIEQCRTNEK